MKNIKRIFILFIAFMLSSLVMHSINNTNDLNTYAEETDNYLTFTAKGGSVTIGFNYIYATSPQYKINDGEWTDLTSSVINLNEDDYVKFKANGISFNFDYHITMSSLSGGTVEASGDITSLLNGVGGDVDLSEGTYGFSSMFEDCTIMTKAPNLPSTTLRYCCYYGTFYGCSGLTETPELPATNLAPSCYFATFGGCTSLTTLPNLPATNLCAGCYDSMFCDCTGLKMSETKSGNYSLAWSINENAVSASSWNYEMFSECGTDNCCDTYSGGSNIEIGKTYYLYVPGYTVTYDDNVENEVIEMPTDDNSYQKDDYALVTTITPTRAGYNFIGWNTDKTSTTKKTFENGKIKIEEESITLYAIWEEKTSISILETAQSYSYDGSSHSFIVKNSTNNITGFKIEYLVDGEYSETAPTNVGSYNVKVTRTEDDTYKAYEKIINNGLIINKAKIAVPTANTNLKYTGSEVTGVTLPLNAKYTLTDNTNTSLGSYTAKASLTDKTNYEWDLETPTSSDQYISYTISKGQAVITVDDTPIVKTYNEIVTIPTATTNLGTVSCDKTSSDLVDAGTYTITYTVDSTSNYDGATKTVSVTINKLKVAVPTLSGSYTYNKSSQTVIINWFDSETMKESSDSVKSATSAGNYKVKIELKDKLNYEWSTTFNGELSWSISKAQAAITLNTTPIVVKEGETLTLPNATSNFGTVSRNKESSDMLTPGLYNVIYSVDGTDNYFGITKELSVTVNAAVLEKTNVEDATIKEVTVETDNGFNPLISLEVKIILEDLINTETTIVDYSNLSFDNISALTKKERVGAIFDVKLINSLTNEAVQPSDGETVTVRMLLPESIDVSKITRVLHVHSESTATEIEFNLDMVDSDGYFTFDTDKFSEFAFVYEVDEVFPWWAIVLIVLGSLIIIFIVLFFIWKNEYDKASKNDDLDDRSLSKLDIIYLPVYKLYNKLFTIK